MWLLVSAAMISLSALATMLTMLHLRFGWDVRVSSVRWLFWLFFLYLFVYSSSRAVYIIWLLVLPRFEDEADHRRHLGSLLSTATGTTMGATIDENNAAPWLLARLDRVGIQTIADVHGRIAPWSLANYCIGDLGLLGIGLSLLCLTYELFRLARVSMDRGAEKERLRIRWYCYGIHGIMAVFAAVEIAFLCVYGRYTKHLRRCLLAVYIVQFIGLAFMLGQLLVLKLKGRKYETVHGTFVTSPAYARLKRIMFVYAIFSLQFQISFFVLSVSSNPSKYKGLLESIAISRVLYYFTGLALAITTSCSQACVLAACRCCMPEEFEAQYLHTRFFDGKAPNVDDLEAPRADPVFVFTDIQSSTALWAVGNGSLMEEASEIHDDIIRSTLSRYHGYEITTVGDAFQLAFRSIADAVNFCLDVQLQLLVAEWPKEIHGAVPATKKVRAGRRLLFNGLRVRMGIHDAIDYEGPLVQGTHAVTGKATYSGLSAVVAEFVGDLGSGGQILVTERVARWLKYRSEDVSLEYELDHIGPYAVPYVNLEVDIFQLTPSMLARRRAFFGSPDKGRGLLQHPPRPISSRGSRRFVHANSLSSPVIMDYVPLDVARRIPRR